MLHVWQNMQLVRNTNVSLEKAEKLKFVSDEYCLCQHEGEKDIRRVKVM